MPPHTGMSGQNLGRVPTLITSRQNDWFCARLRTTNQLVDVSNAIRGFEDGVHA